MGRLAAVARTLATRRLALSFDRVPFSYTGLSARRLRTWLGAEVGYLLRRPRPLTLPTHLQVEPASVCNLRCPVCHVVTEEGPRGMLELADYRRLLDEVGDDILFLHLWGWGEPFLNPDIFRMFRLGADRGLRMISSTNGHFFTEEGDVDRLVDSGLDALIVALDGLDAATYERYRRRGDLARVLDGLARLTARKRERGAATPLVNLRMLVTRDNEHQVAGLKALGAELGVDMVTLKTLCSFDAEAEARALLPVGREYRRFTYGPDGRPRRVANSCKKLWNHPTVYRDGTVVACDYHTVRELPLGNAFGEGGFAGVWWGEELVRLRERFARGAVADVRCGRCSLNYAGVDRCVSHAFPVAKAPA